MKNSLNINTKEILGCFCHCGVQSLYEIGQLQYHQFFHVCWGSFVSNQIVFQSNRYRIEIESNGFCTLSIENRIESKPIRFDSPVCIRIPFILTHQTNDVVKHSFNKAINKRQPIKSTDDNTTLLCCTRQYSFPSTQCRYQQYLSSLNGIWRDLYIESDIVWG
jgi:hypothetical protein